MEQFSLLPTPSDEEKYVILAKFPIELLEKLEKQPRDGAEQISIKFDKENNGFTINGLTEKFRSEVERLDDHNCFCQEGGYWAKVGPIKSKIFFAHNLSSNDQHRIAKRTKQAEEDRKNKHKSVFIDPTQEPSKKRRGKSTQIKRSTVKGLASFNVKGPVPTAAAVAMANAPKKSLIPTTEKTPDKPLVPKTKSLTPPSTIPAVTQPSVAPVQYHNTPIQSVAVTQPSAPISTQPISTQPSAPISTQPSAPISTQPTAPISTQPVVPIVQQPEPVASSNIAVPQPEVTNKPENVKPTKKEYQFHEKLPGETLRKYLIQLLAITPASIQKLSRIFGPKQDVSSIMPKVASFKSPGNWHLKKELFKEVDVSWKDYSEEDRKKVATNCKKMVNTAKPPQVDQSKPTEAPIVKEEEANSIKVTDLKPITKKKEDLSPPVVVAAKEEDKSGSLVLTLPNLKKLKASDLKRKAPSGTDSTENKVQKTDKIKQVKDKKVEPQQVEESMDVERKKEEAVKPKKENQTEKNSNAKRVEKPKQSIDSVEKKQDKPIPPKTETKTSNHTSENNTKKTDKRKNAKRPEISSREMYLEYKLEYNAMYAEYSSLISEIESTQKLFADLGETWKKAPSADQENINKKIVSLYQENYEKTKEMKARYQQLHSELKDLKQLIKNAKEFDLDGKSVQNLN